MDSCLAQLCGRVGWKETDKGRAMAAMLGKLHATTSGKDHIHGGLGWVESEVITAIAFQSTSHLDFPNSVFYLVGNNFQG